MTLEHFISLTETRALLQVLIWEKRVNRLTSNADRWIERASSSIHSMFSVRLSMFDVFDRVKLCGFFGVDTMRLPRGETQAL
jgi:hypothetical protein